VFPRRGLGSLLGAALFELHSTGPVIASDLFVAFDEVTGDISLATPRSWIRFGFPGCREQDAVANGACRRFWTGPIGIVDAIDEAEFIAGGHRAVAPIEQHIVDKIEIVAHADARVAAGVGREQVVVK